MPDPIPGGFDPSKEHSEDEQKTYEIQEKLIKKLQEWSMLLPPALFGDDFTDELKEKINAINELIQRGAAEMRTIIPEDQ